MPGSRKTLPCPHLQKKRGKGGPNDPFKDFYDRFFGQRPEQRPRGGTGSGFIIDAQGHILTNYHVVEGAEEITVTLDDDREYTAEVIGSDSKTDIALIKISHENGEKSPFPFLKLGDSGNLERIIGPSLSLRRWGLDLLEGTPGLI